MCKCLYSTLVHNQCNRLSSSTVLLSSSMVTPSPIRSTTHCIVSRFRSENCSIRSPSMKFLHSPFFRSLLNDLHSSWLRPPTPLTACRMQSCTHQSSLYHTQTFDSVLTDTSIRQQVANKTQGDDDSLTFVVEKERKTRDVCCQLHICLQMNKAYCVMCTMLQMSLQATSIAKTVDNMYHCTTWAGQAGIAVPVTLPETHIAHEVCWQ